MKHLKNIATLIFLGIFCFTLFVVAITRNAKSPNYNSVESMKFDKEFSGIAKVIDGDSIIVENKEVRLFGIDAPEYKQECFNEKNLQYSCGKMAQEFLQKLINNKKVICHYSTLDFYNRHLAKCELGEISINEEIIKNGMAVIYDFKQSDEIMINLESQAKEQKLGIWQGAFQLPKDYRKSHPRKK